jgi:hypothetical protein
VPRICQCHQKGRVSYPRFLQLVEPMGVEPTTSRVRFQIIGRQQIFANKTLQAFQYIRLTMFGLVRHTSALVLGEKADSVGVKSGVALLIAHLMVCSNPTLRKFLSAAVRELSVSSNEETAMAY